jgi:hypothetical protein
MIARGDGRYGGVVVWAAGYTITEKQDKVYYRMRAINVGKKPLPRRSILIKIIILLQYCTCCISQSTHISNS